MSEKKIIKKRKASGKKHNGGSKKIRKITIKDARNTWVLEALVSEKIIFDLKDFSGFYFTYDGENLDCFKRVIKRVSDNGKMASFDDRYNLINDSGERKTIRLKNLKKHLKDLLEC